MAHAPPLATDPPVSEIVVKPAVAVAVPPQEFVRLAGVATTRPAGKGSGKAMLLVAVELEMLKVSEVDPLSGMVDAPNPLVKVGAGPPLTGPDPGAASATGTTRVGKRASMRPPATPSRASRE